MLMPNINISPKKITETKKIFLLLEKSGVGTSAGGNTIIEKENQYYQLFICDKQRKVK